MKTELLQLLTLSVIVQGYRHDSSTFLLKLSETFPALHTFSIAYGESNDVEWSWNISEFESVLNALGSIKKLKISGMHCELKFTDGVDKPMIKSAMQEALEIIEKKFPFNSTGE